MAYRVCAGIGNTRRVASNDRPSLIRPSAPKQRAGEEPPVHPAPAVSLVRRPKVSLVRRSGVTPVSLVKRRPSVDLVKRVSLSKRRRPAIDDPWAPTRPPVRSHRRSRLSPTQVFAAAGTGAGRGLRATRSWARRPAGRMILPGLLMLLLVTVAFAGGAWLPQVTGNEPIAAAPSDEETAYPSEGASGLPDEPPADGNQPVLPSQDPSAPPAGQQTAANTLSAWAAPLAVRTNIPLVALEAYALAELTVAQSHPGCNLRWTTLAGIGRNESNHGQSGNATLNTDGRSSPPIYGPPLDGTNNNKAIQDTDDGQLDSDIVWDRAIGPMQFIPTTWKQYAVDADGDGRADPHDIDDAALASARYLCAGERNLATAAGWKAAILAYNNVEVYATNVFNAANDYGLKSRA
jgi:membrane-bound lytic murein transglycosylase B